MSIQNELDKIKYGVKGKDVRGAIHDGIKQAYDDASEKGNANMEVKMARGESSTLGKRLEKMNKTTTELYGSLNSNFRKNDKLITLNDADEEMLAAIEGGEGTNFEINAIPKDDSVSLSQLTPSWKALADIKFEQGNLSAVGSNHGSFYDHRIRTGFLSFDGPRNIVVHKDVQVFIHYFEHGNTDTSVKRVGWISGKEELEEGYLVRFLAAYKEDYAAEKPLRFESVEELAAKIKIEGLKPDKSVDELKEKVEDTSFVIGNPGIEFELGGIEAVDNHPKPFMDRIRTADFIEANQFAKVTLDDTSNTQRMAVRLYREKDHGTHFLDTGWLTDSYTIDVDCYFKVLGSYKDDSLIEDNGGVAAIADNITIEAYTPKVVERLVRNQMESEEMVAYTEALKLLAEKVNGLQPTVKGIAHRGYNTVAPENTLPAYRLAKEKGFGYVEADIMWTKDNEPVLLHDTTIDRTSNGTGNISDYTLAELKELDFGSWKGAEYAGTKIPTLREFILFCKKNNLHPYIEEKGVLSVERAKKLVGTVKKLGMKDHVTWISFHSDTLVKIDEQDTSARMGFLGSLSESLINTVISLQSNKNSVFANVQYGTVTRELAESALMQDVPVEVWSLNSESLVHPLVEKGISGITTDYLNIASILVEDNI